MYSQQQAFQLKQAFWTKLGQYMSPIPSSEGEKINWINYKTGITNLSFKMEADIKGASIAIVLSQPDTSLQQLYYEQFLQLKTIFSNMMAEQWQWQAPSNNEYDKTKSRIHRDITGTNILRQEDWPALITFFKPRLLLLDEFWNEVKYALYSLL